MIAYSGSRVVHRDGKRIRHHKKKTGKGRSVKCQALELTGHVTRMSRTTDTRRAERFGKSS